MITKGTINRKTINGKNYYYHQYLDNSKQVSKVINEDEAYSLAFNIYFKGSVDELNAHVFNTDVSYGEKLRKLSRVYLEYKHRFCYNILDNFINDDTIVNRLFALYGLRRTGKTTLMMQSINSFNIRYFYMLAYLKCGKNNTFKELIDDIKFLLSQGFKYVYIDEITLLEDFMAASSLLSDVYGSMAKIVISGTDSLGFLIASRNELYNRIEMLHTTYISYKEFATILGNKTIDEYIEYGGTMVKEGVDYNKTLLINNNKINEYVDSAISHNIVHSLKCYKDGRYFSSLYELYENNELENVINRIVEDTNHRFAISVIDRAFKSHDYGSLKKLIMQPNNYSDLGEVLNNVDEDKLLKDLMNALSIVDKEERKVDVKESVLLEIQEYLSLLDVYSEVNEISYPLFEMEKRNVFTQPGLRYSQAKELLKILLNDEAIRKYPDAVINLLSDKLLSDIKGRMLEDIVLLEVSKSGKEAFKFKFGPLGEFDMVVIDSKEHVMDLYEIKHSSLVNEKQARFLNDKKLISIIQNKYYPVRHLCVLYNGEDKEIGDIKYLNVSNFLLNQ